MRRPRTRGPLKIPSRSAAAGMGCLSPPPGPSIITITTVVTIITIITTITTITITTTITIITIITIITKSSNAYN